jgi:hypothetical protein
LSGAQRSSCHETRGDDDRCGKPQRKSHAWEFHRYASNVDAIINQR